MKSYADRFFSEMNLAGGTGSAFGNAYSPGGMGTYGNAIQTTDWYASNDARQPFPKGSTRLNKRSNPLNKPRKVKNGRRKMANSR
jgi:hypothetical protein